jgi:3-methyl-2-oxobutanoate hydroxymethyltransferase
VWHDLAGLTPGKPLRFVKRYADANELLAGAAAEFVDEVRTGAFPRPEHGWLMDETEMRAWSENGLGEED